MPASFITSITRGFKLLGSTATLTTLNRSAVRVRRKPSAIRLRVALPVERNRTFGLCFVISFHFIDSSWPILSTGVVSRPYAGTSHGARQSRFAQYWRINVALPRVVPPTFQPRRSKNRKSKFFINFSPGGLEQGSEGNPRQATAACLGFRVPSTPSNQERLESLSPLT